MSDPFCPATMCPLFAPNGSPWTGEKNARCNREACAWWNEGRCDGAAAAREQALRMHCAEAIVQLGPVYAKRGLAASRSYDCPRAHECQWQIEAGDKLCPPRAALALGVDPKACAW